MVLGFDAEKRGLMNCCKISAGMNSGAWRELLMDGRAMSSVAVDREMGVLQTSCGEVKASTEMRIWLGMGVTGFVLFGRVKSFKRLWRPKPPLRRAT